MKHLALGIICACGLAAAACAGTASPTSPTTTSSFTTGGAGTAVSTPMGSVATGVGHAIALCHGPVLQTLEGVFGSSSTPIVISDNGSVVVLSFSNPGRTFTLGVTYLDNDGSGGLSCGDTVTGVA